MIRSQLLFGPWFVAIPSTPSIRLEESSTVCELPHCEVYLLNIPFFCSSFKTYSFLVLALFQSVLSLPVSLLVDVKFSDSVFQPGAFEYATLY
jgi:hypothetical protein